MSPRNNTKEERKAHSLGRGGDKKLDEEIVLISVDQYTNNIYIYIYIYIYMFVLA